MPNTKYKTLFFSKNEENDESLIRFEKFIIYKKQNPCVVNSKEYFKLLYGDSWEFNFNNRKRSSVYDVLYWIKKGFTESEAINKIKEYKSNKATTLINFIKKYGEIEGREKYNDFVNKSKHTKEKFIIKYGNSGLDKWKEYKKTKDSNSYSWALTKCDGDIEKANELLIRRKKTVRINLDFALKKFNNDIKLANEWLYIVNKKKAIDFNWALRKTNTYNEAVNLYTELLDKRKVKFGNASYESSKYFDDLYFKYKDLYRVNYGKFDSNEMFLYDKVNSKSYCYDFSILDKKIIIEFNGIKFHPRLEKYTIKETIDIMPFIKDELSVIQTDNYQKNKWKLAEDLGYKILLIWSDDSQEYNTNKINEFLKQNKI